MHSYVVVARKPNRRIPTHVLELLRQADTADLAFVPDDHLMWMDDAQSVAFAGWQTATDVVPVGSCWHVGERGLTTFAGRMWPKGGVWRAGTTWAEQLESFWRNHPLGDGQQRLDGVYSAVSIAADGRGRIVTDPLSIAMIYRAESTDIVAFATSPRLAARVTAAPGQEPERDPMCVAWLPFLGWLVGDRTGYTSTRVIPMGAGVEIDPAYGSRLRYSNPTPWVADLPTDEDALIRLVHEDLSASVRSIAQLPTQGRDADITGGKDSRLVLALMLQEGVADRFTFHTAGYDHSPDAIVGKAIAERFHLTHRHRVPLPVQEEELRRRLATHALQTVGMFSAWEMKGSVRPPSSLKVTGCVGEVLRTNFKSYPVMSTVDELRDLFYGQSGLRGPGILRRQVRNELLDLLDAALVGRLDVGGSAPQDLADSFYCRYRIRRWFGTYEELGDLGRVFPLYSLVGLQAAFAVGATRRRLEAVNFGVMNLASPELARMPFADRGWAEALTASLPDADRYRVAPVRHDGKGPAPTQWRPQRLLDNVDVARELLLDEPSNPVHEILDRDAVRRVLDAPDQASPVECRQIFGALAAAVWLGRHESRARIGATATPDDFEPSWHTGGVTAPVPVSRVPSMPPSPNGGNARLLPRIRRGAARRIASRVPRRRS